MKNKLFKNKKRLFSMALAVLMIFSMIPFTSLGSESVVKAAENDFGYLEDYALTSEFGKDLDNCKFVEKKYLSRIRTTFPNYEYYPTDDPFTFNGDLSMDTFCYTSSSDLIASNSGSSKLSIFFRDKSMKVATATFTERQQEYNIYKDPNGKLYCTVNQHFREVGFTIKVYNPNMAKLEEELAKAKEEAKKEIDKLENLSEEDKNKAKTDIDNATDKTTVDKIVEDAKKKDADNKTAADEKAKEEELAKAKEEAKKEIDKLENLSEEDKDKAKTDIDNATDKTTVDKIVEDAKKKDADNKTAADEKAKEEELAKAKEDAKSEIDKLENLTDDEKADFDKKVDDAKSVDEVNKVLEDAKKKDADNKTAADEKAKEEELAKAKEDAKSEIDKLENLSEEDKNKAKSDIDNASDIPTVNQIVEDAKKKDADNKTAADEKAKEEELAKAKEEAKKEINSNPDLTNADKDKYAKDIDNAKTVKEVRDILDEAKKKAEAKINENDPEYLKNKLKGLIEEAKRVRYPSEELEEAIDEAYDILLDRYSRIEDYKYAIENLERILQNMRDTRRNRFKLDVDDLNEKDEELTGKTETKWYIDVYNGKKRILSGQANYKGDFAIEIKKGKIKAKDTLKVVATDPQNDKKYKEVEIEVGGDSKETKDNKPTFNINDLLQADGSKPLTDLAVFPVGKNFYNVVQNGQKTTVYMDVKTFISGNRTMLPIRYIAYTLGFNVEYDNFTREAIFSNTENSALAKKTIRVNIDTGLMKDSYGNVFASDVRPVLINNRIHASIANIARMFEASQGTIEDGINQTIEWDSARKAVYVFKNIK